MAKEFEILSMRDDGHAHVRVKDDDGTTFEHSLTIPQEIFALPVVEAAEAVKDFIYAYWPTEELAKRRAVIDPVALSAAIGPKVVLSGTPAEARQRVSMKLGKDI